MRLTDADFTEYNN